MKCSCEEFEENHPKCTVCSQGKQIVAQENKRRYILQNPSGKKICRIQIDGCVISSTSKSKKCDYLIVVCKSEAENQENHSEDFYFIELKGKDLIRAVEQLTETIQHFQSGISGKVLARAVVSKVAVRAIETDARVQRLRKLLKQYKGDFAYGSQQYEKDRI